MRHAHGLAPARASPTPPSQYLRPNSSLGPHSETASSIKQALNPHPRPALLPPASTSCQKALCVLRHTFGQSQPKLDSQNTKRSLQLLHTDGWERKMWGRVRREATDALRCLLRSSFRLLLKPPSSDFQRISRTRCEGLCVTRTASTITRFAFQNPLPPKPPPSLTNCK